MHPLLELLLRHLPVRDEEAEPRAELLELLPDLVDRLDAVVEVEGLPAARVLALERGLDELLVELADRRAHRAAAGRRRLDDRDVAEPGERHVERARNRRRGQREDVDLEPQRAQELLLRHAEALLLVEHDEAKVLRDDVAREDAVRSDQDVHLALLELLQDARLVRARAEARHHLDAHREVAVALAEGVPVLLREDRRRAEHEGLAAVQRDGEGGSHCDLGLPEADVAAHEPIHRPPRLEVLLHGLDRLLLILGLPVRERALEPLEPVVREVERLPGRLSPACVQREELAGELAHGRASAALEVLPRLPAELGERRRLRVRSDVARDLRDLLVRNVEAVLAAEGEEEVVARDAGDVLRLEAEEPADAVILVDDVVADAKVGEGLERTAETGVDARRPLAEDLRVREERDPEVPPDEAPPRRADDERDRGVGGDLVDVVVDGRLDLPEQALRSQRLALVRERDDHTTPLPHHRGELVLRLGEATRRDRRAAAPRRRAAAIAGVRRVARRRRGSAARAPPRPRGSRRRRSATRGRAGLAESDAVSPRSVVVERRRVEDALARRIDRRLRERDGARAA